MQQINIAILVGNFYGTFSDLNIAWCSSMAIPQGTRWKEREKHFTIFNHYYAFLLHPRGINKFPPLNDNLYSTWYARTVPCQLRNTSESLSLCFLSFPAKQPIQYNRNVRLRFFLCVEIFGLAAEIFSIYIFVSQCISPFETITMLGIFDFVEYS